jgi:DNA-directed RNA polymerase subunit M/transcription elongation factor TFIIS
MPSTLILQCKKCTGLLLAPASQKTRTCPHCGTKIEVAKAKRIASAQNAFEASKMLRIIKEKNQSNALNHTQRKLT